MPRATGTFTVTITPVANDAPIGVAALGRMTLVKQFSGDLDGTGAGEMLTAMTGITGSAGYVAIERVDATLAGRRGTFVLQHNGTMTRGAPQLEVNVVPDSGTGELVGITGTFAIIITAGRHDYAFDYILPAVDEAAS